MKTTLIALLALILGIGGADAERQIKTKDLRPMHFSSSLRVLNISASSPYSYNDAMNRLARMTPAGYSISSIQYVRDKGYYLVLVKLIK